MLGLAWALKRKEASPSSGLSLKWPHASKGLAEVSRVEQTPKMCRGLIGPSISLVINWLIRTRTSGLVTQRSETFQLSTCCTSLPRVVSGGSICICIPLVGNAEREMVVSVRDKGENQLGTSQVSEILS